MTFWRQNPFWRCEGHYAARCNSGGMVHLADLAPDQPDAFCFAEELWTRRRLIHHHQTLQQKFQRVGWPCAEQWQRH